MSSEYYANFVIDGEAIGVQLTRTGAVGYVLLKTA